MNHGRPAAGTESAGIDSSGEKRSAARATRLRRRMGGVEVRLRRRADPGLAHELVAPVAEHERAVAELAVSLALLLERVLDLEQVGEVGSRVEPQLDVH